MENENQNINEVQPRSTNMWMYILLAVLALVVIGLSVWLISVKNEVKTLKTEKEFQRMELEKELDSIMNEHAKIKEEYGELSDSLAGMDSVFQANAKEIKQLLNYKWEYYKVKKKLSSLQVIAQGYVRKMDSIVTVNQELTQENFEIKEEIKKVKYNYQNLEKEKGALEEKVDEASVLHAYNMTATPVHVKGSGKEVPTDKIKRVQRITVCFTVGKNTIVEAGKKTVYLRLARPDKEILMKGRGEKYTFEYQGKTLQYSQQKTFDYQNESVDLCLKYNIRGTQELQPGVYHADLFVGDNNIGHTTFTLK